MDTTVKPPIAKKHPCISTHHNIQRTDEYAWLRAENWRDVMQSPQALSPDIMEYIESENAYTKEWMGDTESLQKQLFAEMKGRVEEDDQSVPNIDGEYAYYVRYQADKEYPIFCRYPLSAPDVEEVLHAYSRGRIASDPLPTPNSEEVLLDSNRVAESHAYLKVGDLQHSPDHRFIAYTLDTDGSEFYTLYLQDLASQQMLDEVILRVQGEVVWSSDSKHVFYVGLDEEHRPAKVCRHQIGTSAKDDVIVYQEKDKSFFINLDKTRSRRFIVIDIHAHQTSECYLLDAEDACCEPVLVRKRQAGVEYFVEHQRDGFLIRTNLDGAKDYKLMRATGHACQWTDFYVPNKGVLLEDVMVFEDWIVCCERENGLPRLLVMEVDDRGQRIDTHRIMFDEACYELAVEENDQYPSDTLRFSYSSMTTPEEIYDYDMKTRKRHLRKRQRVPSGHDPQDYQTKRMFATSVDGAKVPISMLYAKAHPPTANSPLLLYGYGAYGHTTAVSFSTTRLCLVERGFVFAIAHIRGGMEKGYDWYQEGKMENKKNTFYDFIACARHLIDSGFTSPDRLAICGGSAGGMLIGTVLNMHPELFSAALADVPFVDVLNTMLDDDLPLTPPEWVEWGNPITDEATYRYIASYSPYDNVRACVYPHLLVTAGLSDPRVTYWEPAKWVAKLRAQKKGDTVLLLKTNITAGHAGKSGRYDSLKEVALQYAFLLKVLCPLSLSAAAHPQ